MEAEQRHYRRGDVVTLTATVWGIWTDSDKGRRNKSLAKWAQLTLPSGGRVMVPVADLEPAEEPTE